MASPKLPSRTRAAARHRRVAQPAVAVVPVADAADGARAGWSWPRRRCAPVGPWQRRLAAPARCGATGSVSMGGQVELVGPALPELVGVVRDAPRSGCGSPACSAGRAVAELEHDRPVGEVDLGPGGVVARRRRSAPTDARAPAAPSRSAVSTTSTPSSRTREPGAVRGRSRGGVRTRPRPCPCPRRRGRGRCGRPGGRGGRRSVEVVGDGAAPASSVSSTHRVVDVALAGGPSAVDRAHGEVARGRAADQLGEDRRRVDAGRAEPGDAGVGRDDGDGALVGEQRVVARWGRRPSR